MQWFDTKTCGLVLACVDRAWAKAWSMVPSRTVYISKKQTKQAWTCWKTNKKLSSTLLRHAGALILSPATQVENFMHIWPHVSTWLFDGSSLPGSDGRNGAIESAHSLSPKMVYVQFYEARWPSERLWALASVRMLELSLCDDKCAGADYSPLAACVGVERFGLTWRKEDVPFVPETMVRALRSLPLLVHLGVWQNEDDSNVYNIPNLSTRPLEPLFEGEGMKTLTSLCAFQMVADVVLARLLPPSLTELRPRGWENGEAIRVLHERLPHLVKVCLVLPRGYQSKVFASLSFPHATQVEFDGRGFDSSVLGGVLHSFPMLSRLILRETSVRVLGALPPRLIELQILRTPMDPRQLLQLVPLVHLRHLRIDRSSMDIDSFTRAMLNEPWGRALMLPALETMEG